MFALLQITFVKLPRNEGGYIFLSPECWPRGTEMSLAWLVRHWLY